MNKSKFLYIRFAVGIVGVLLIIAAAIFLITSHPKAELPEGNPLLVNTENTNQTPQADTDEAEGPLPSGADASAAPDLSWEWPVDADGNIIIDPSSNSDIPPDAGGGTNADTP
jgi:hypothetical protein